MQIQKLRMSIDSLHQEKQKEDEKLKDSLNKAKNKQEQKIQSIDQKNQTPAQAFINSRDRDYNFVMHI